MIWQYILTGLSCALFFGFVALCVAKFGLQSCYSAYGPLWREALPEFNIWSAVTLATAFLLIPPLLESSDGNPWQYTGFLCPALIMFVALTPDYNKGGMPLTVHSFCAAGGALFAVLYIIFVAPQLWWLIVLYLGLATAAMLHCGRWSFVFWYEMAAYAATYTVMFVII